MHVVNWFTRAAFPFLTPMFAAFQRLPAWKARMAALGVGIRTEISADEAHKIARQAKSLARKFVDPADPLGLSVGDRINVAATSLSRGETVGHLARLVANEVAIRPEDAAIEGLFVHFPRLGCKISSLPAVR